MAVCVFLLCDVDVSVQGPQGWEHGFPRWQGAAAHGVLIQLLPWSWAGRSGDR